jgi:hypothetical protein
MGCVGLYGKKAQLEANGSGENGLEKTDLDQNAGVPKWRRMDNGWRKVE